MSHVVSSENVLPLLLASAEMWENVHSKLMQKLQLIEPEELLEVVLRHSFGSGDGFSENQTLV